MPRAGQPPASTLRNRNRITNKTRLKIVHGNIDVDPIIPDEDEEKNRLLQSVAGVDLDDANEHHLQAVLSEAASKNYAEQAAAFIPIPEAAGVADNYELLYPIEQWRDPVSYVQSTAVIEEYTSAALADGCTYYMDERDKEWFDRNNEEARGEGTSAQGSVLTSTGRASARSAKAKGKEPEELHPILMSEDEFELLMGLFEKITQEKTEFLHHSLESGHNHFPEFSEYQQVLSVPLPLSTFASYAAPSWLPQPSHLLRLGRVVYPYWKERCLERAGRRIIPPLNFDEADTLNESYVCFRRRETKAVRKTRASQVTSSDKLARLQSEFEFPLQLAKQLLSREQMKRDSARQSQVVWDLRMKLVEMKAKNPTLGEKADDELFVDKERKPPRVRLPIKPELSTQPATPARDILRPKERQSLYQSKIDALLQAHKEQDQQWEDHVDTGYVSTFQPYSSRLFKYIHPPERFKRLSSDSDSGDTPVAKRPIRLRCGRGGRTFIDRRPSAAHTSFTRRRRLSVSDDEEDIMDIDEDQEADRRLSERWRFDADDGPSYGSNGPEEQDRVLVDDYDVKYMSRVVTLLGESDYNTLTTDPTIARITADGKREFITPFRLGVMPPVIKGLPSRAMPISQQGQHGAPNGTHVAIPMHQGVAISQQLKMPPSTTIQGASISGVVHTPSPVPSSPAQSSSTSMIPSPQVTHNGRAAMNMPRVDMMKLVFNNSAGSSAFPQKGDESHTQSEDQQQIPRPKSQQQVHMQSHQPDQAQALVSVNGLHPAYAALASVNPASYNISHYIPHSYPTNPAPSGLNNQQVQHLKSVFNAANASGVQNYNSALFAQMQMPKNTNTNGIVNGSLAAVPSGNGSPQHVQNLAPGMNLKLPPVRQMQQRVANGNSMNGTSPSPPRPTNAVNGVQQQQHGSLNNSPSPRMMHAVAPGEHVPARSPSANGSRSGLRAVNGNGMQGGGAQMGHVQMQQQHQMMLNGQIQQQQMLQMHSHSQSPKPTSYITNSSPQSYSLSPKMQPASNIPSPLMQQQQQQQQAVGGNSQGVY